MSDYYAARRLASRAMYPRIGAAARRDAMQQTASQASFVRSLTEEGCTVLDVQMNEMGNITVTATEADGETLFMANVSRRGDVDWTVG